MQQLARKVKRLDPILEIRKSRFETENQKLVALKQKKEAASLAVQRKQAEYMEGLERLNQERNTSERSMLEALEIGLDSIKQDWISLYALMVDCERAETLQHGVVIEVFRDLESIKVLQSKYQTSLRQQELKSEQKSFDELALKRFGNQSRRGHQ
jgi:flagellar biosynthesis chaperone FliJ